MWSGTSSASTAELISGGSKLVKYGSGFSGKISRGDQVVTVMLYQLVGGPIAARFGRSDKVSHLINGSVFQPSKSVVVVGHSG